ncbi:MAG: TraB/GumN family protein [Oscillospiraceae bacterium]|nr:TraB/GumN family protein [Oscillospiraceae bacterium]
MKKLIAMILCAAMLLSLAGCKQAPLETTEATTTIPAESTDAPATVLPVPTEAVPYAEAVAQLEAAGSVSLDLLITKYTTVAGDEFSEQSTQTLTYQGMGTEDLVIAMDEQMDFSVHTREEEEEDRPDPVSYKEVWGQGTVYAVLDDTYRFSEAVDAENAALRYTPVGLLNAGLYGSITTEDTAEGTLFTFAQPTAGESWAVPEEAELLEAAGTALINAGGTLEKMTYTVTYLYGTTEITLEAESSPMDTPLEVAIPADADAYTPISCIEALRMYISSMALMMQADAITSTGIESMFSQAAGVVRNQSTVVNLSGRKEDTAAKFEYGVYFMDYTTGKDEQYDLEETYIDGIYTSVEDDGLPVTDPGFTWEEIREYAIEEFVMGTVDPSFWQEVTGTDMGSVYFFEFTLNDSFGKAKQGDVCEMLWDDPSFLLNMSTKYVNKEVSCYLSVDKYTGLPVAAGFYYEGVHTIEGYGYPLTVQFDQSIEAPSKGAYKEITGEMPVEEAPENKATPVFYHVTGENGQEMWLLGTIHVGDERTAYLPQEIYDAFAASDALAIECDTKAFEEQVEEDEALSEEVSSMYFYAGISLKVMMEEETYNQAEKLLKAVGGYNMNMPYAKPYLWSSTIDDFYMRQGYQLHRDQGVEERLYTWAEELDKEIREVESSMFQLKMLTGFSKDLQIMMLEDSMEYSAQEYWESTMELYELWCAGDEAALREELSDEVDMTDWTEEEKTEYEESKHLIDEYNQAMSYDRNDGMLEKATEYLESGDVVFYAVGLAHLLNNVNGLVDTLQEAGYTVELVTYAG